MAWRKTALWQTCVQLSTQSAVSRCCGVIYSLYSSVDRSRCFNLHKANRVGLEEEMTFCISSLSVLFILSEVHMASAATATCSINRYGGLEMFNGDYSRVKAPCKYRLAFFDCGDYTIEVLATSAVDRREKDRFTPSGIVVKVNISSSWWIGSVSNQSMQRISDDVWKTGRRELSLVSDCLSILDGKSCLKAMVYKLRIFEVSFSQGGSSDGVDIKCYSAKRDFQKGAFPSSMCGDMSGLVAVTNFKETIFGANSGVGNEVAILYAVLNSNQVITKQSGECSGTTSDFKGFNQEQKRNSIEVCSPILVNSYHARCFVKEHVPMLSFYDCMMSIALNSTVWCASFKRVLDEKCGYQKDTFKRLPCIE